MTKRKPWEPKGLPPFGEIHWGRFVDALVAEGHDVEGLDKIRLASLKKAAKSGDIENLLLKTYFSFGEEGRTVVEKYLREPPALKKLITSTTSSVALTFKFDFESLMKSMATVGKSMKEFKRTAAALKPHPPAFDRDDMAAYWKSLKHDEVLWGLPVRYQPEVIVKSPNDSNSMIDARLYLIQELGWNYQQDNTCVQNGDNVETEGYFYNRFNRHVLQVVEQQQAIYFKTSSRLWVSYLMKFLSASPNFSWSDPHEGRSAADISLERLSGQGLALLQHRASGWQVGLAQRSLTQLTFALASWCRIDRQQHVNGTPAWLTEIPFYLDQATNTSGEMVDIHHPCTCGSFEPWKQCTCITLPSFT